MSPPLPSSFGVVLPFVSAMLLAGCTSFEPEKSVDQINQQFSAFTQSSLKPALIQEQKPNCKRLRIVCFKNRFTKRCSADCTDE
jgi:outer membrane PBP1 activator LpoA protein